MNGITGDNKVTSPGTQPGDDGPIIVGIDLGTTNSLVAYADKAGPRVLVEDDRALLPSVVGFDADGAVNAVGRSARAHAVERPLTTVYSVKRLMGRGYDQLGDEIAHLAYPVVRRAGDDGRDIAAVKIGSKKLTPPQISAVILGELKRRAERHFGRPITQAAITVPAYFDDAQRQATRDAGTIAGLDVVRIINEPTAAALAYGLGRKSDTTIAVYDWGGGTFDVSLLKLSRDVFEVISTGGDTLLGGDDLDREIIRLAIAEIHEQFDVDIDSPRIRQSLRDFAEAVKIELSTHPRKVLEIDLGDGRVYRREITVEQFEAMIEPWVDRTLERCREALRDARLRPQDIEAVVMVGGSTRIPYVRRRVGEFFSRQPYTAIDPEQVVAMGAAIQASVLAGTRRDMLLLDVTPLSLGIETMGGAMGKLIMKNTKIPCRATESFTTFKDGQTSVQINVLQGERELAKDCRSLGVFHLTGVPAMGAGMPKVDVSFLIDANGILNVSAKERRSGTVAGIQIVPTHGLTGEEVQRMTKESVAHAVADLSEHRLIDLRNQVAFDTHKTAQMLELHGKALPADRRREIIAQMAALRELARTTDNTDELHTRLNEFDRMTVPLAEIAMTATLRSDEDEDETR